MVFTGLVVGGHLAGEWRSHDLPCFTDQAPSGGKVDYENGDVLLWDGFKIFEPITYVHTVSSPIGEFWVPQGRNASWAIAELIRYYQRHS
jgi:hypothetical protein